MKYNKFYSAPFLGAIDLSETYIVDENYRDYETVVVLSPILNETDYNSISKKISKQLEDNKCTIIEFKQIGLLKLAYKINNFTNGYYMFFSFKALPSFVRNLEIFYKRDERIIRSIVCSLPKEGVKYNELRKSKNENIIKTIDVNVE